MLKIVVPLSDEPIVIPNTKKTVTIERRILLPRLKEVLHGELFPFLVKAHAPIPAAMQPLLDQLSGHSAPTASRNREFALMMTTLADAFGIAFYHPDSIGTLRHVRVFCGDAVRNFPSGRFQVVTIGANRKTLKTSATWPSLEAGLAPWGQGIFEAEFEAELTKEKRSR